MKDAVLMNSILDRIQIGYAAGNDASCVTEDLVLDWYMTISPPKTQQLPLSWSSSDTRVISDEGNVVRRPDQNETVRLFGFVYLERASEAKGILRQRLARPAIGFGRHGGQQLAGIFMTSTAATRWLSTTV